jgi:hypothetical protein
MWLVAFLSVGGGWFLMEQSKIWNGQEAALRMFTTIGIVQILLAQPDTDAQPQRSRDTAFGRRPQPTGERAEAPFTINPPFATSTRTTLSASRHQPPTHRVPILFRVFYRFTVFYRNVFHRIHTIAGMASARVNWIVLPTVAAALPVFAPIRKTVSFRYSNGSIKLQSSRDSESPHEALS